MDELSGGQFVLVNEAVNLGIAIYIVRQGERIRYETLFRDETVGALDAANGKEYVRMLRRAMDLGGFHQVILYVIQRRFRSSRIGSRPCVMDLLLWGIQEKLLLRPLSVTPP